MAARMGLAVDRSLDPLDALRALREVQELLPEAVRYLAATARDQGVGWQEIAESFGWKNASSAQHLVNEPTEERRAAARKRAEKQRRPGVKEQLPGIGINEAAERLRVARHDIYRRIKIGELEVVEVVTDSGKKLRRITSELPDPEEAD